MHSRPPSVLWGRGQFAHPRSLNSETVGRTSVAMRPWHASTVPRRKEKEGMPADG